MNSGDPSDNFISQRNDGGGRGGRGGLGDDYFERFHINQFYNAVEDEQQYTNEYATLVHRYNDFIVNGTAIFSRMEQTLRENLSRTVVRQSFYYHRFAELRDSRRVRGGNETRQIPIPLSRQAPAASAATPPVTETRYGDIFSRLLSSSMGETNILPMLYTVPLGPRTTDRILPMAPVPAPGPPTNDQIGRATSNTVFGNIISPVNATCPISRDEFNDESEITMIRGCCHVFNRASLREWFANHSTCPMCRRDIRMYREPVDAANTDDTAAAPLHRANMSIDSVDENHVTFSYDLPAHVDDNQIYRDIVNTITGMTAASATQPQPPSRRMDDNYYNYDDDDIMEVD
jgi:hypothetical protein